MTERERIPREGATVRRDDGALGVVESVYPSGVWTARFQFATCASIEGFPLDAFARMVVDAPDSER